MDYQAVADRVKRLTSEGFYAGREPDPLTPLDPERKAAIDLLGGPNMYISNVNWSDVLTLAEGLREDASEDDRKAARLLLAALMDDAYRRAGA